MSCCLFIIRELTKVDALRAELVDLAKANSFGINFHPFDILLTHGQIPLQTWDFVFSLCDTFDYTSCDLVVYKDEHPINGAVHPLPLAERMIVIQKTAEITLRYKKKVEIFLCDDNPYLPDFEVRSMLCEEVAETLCQLYKNRTAPYEIPNIHMIVH